MINYISALPDTAWENAWPRTLCILGSTGSIGRSALDVVARQPGLFIVAGLAAGRNIPLLAKQAIQFRPSIVGVLEAAGASALRQLLPPDYTPIIVTGQKGYAHVASLPEASLVLSAQVGAAGLRATVAAAKAGKVLALANKESLVLAGGLIRALCQESGGVILPVDSEHNAIFQCLVGQAQEAVTRLILTASGGPFRGWSKAELSTVTRDQALAHPNWSMGAKVTVDSATLMNKGLELIEAHHLYGLPMEALDVVVHKESIIHSLVEYADSTQLAHASHPDMRIAIAHCLGWPKRLDTGVRPLNLAACGSLSFCKPDTEAFPCLDLARQAQNRGQGFAIVLNAANEIAVAAFLEGRLGFTHIADLVEHTLCQYAIATGAEWTNPALYSRTLPTPVRQKAPPLNLVDTPTKVYEQSEACVDAILTLDAYARGLAEQALAAGSYNV